jgi:hypothetical protein
MEIISGYVFYPIDKDQKSLVKTVNYKNNESVISLDKQSELLSNYSAKS